MIDFLKFYRRRSPSPRRPPLPPRHLGQPAKLPRIPVNEPTIGFNRPRSALRNCAIKANTGARMLANKVPIKFERRQSRLKTRTSNWVTVELN